MTLKMASNWAASSQISTSYFQIDEQEWKHVKYQACRMFLLARFQHETAKPHLLAMRQRYGSGAGQKWMASEEAYKALSELVKKAGPADSVSFSKNAVWKLLESGSDGVPENIVKYVDTYLQLSPCPQNFYRLQAGRIIPSM